MAKTIGLTFESKVEEKLPKTEGVEVTTTEEEPEVETKEESKTEPTKKDKKADK